MSRFNIRDLRTLAYVPSFTLWHYNAGPQHLSEVQAPGFFKDAADMMEVGDMIIASGIYFQTTCIPVTGETFSHG